MGWVAALALLRIGMGYGGVPESSATVGLSLALTFPFCLYLFGLNDLADERSDRHNPRKGNWVHGARGPVGETRLARYAPWAGGGVVAAFVPVLPRPSALLLAAILAIAWMYSCPPVRLKEIPIVDGLVTAFIMIGLLGVGYLAGGRTVDVPVESWAVTPCLAGLHIFASVLDVASDRQAGHRTLAVRVGPRAAGGIAWLLSVAAVGTAPFLQYAEPILAYMVLQAAVLGVWFAMPTRFPITKAVGVLGAAGLLTLLYLALFYV
ncbi:MAG: UbiA family prenyltransferase [Polyangiaceae bacterium]|jgi:4-hydroxybenzoate polyprenyltransferase|nr:UbiA family prenyltransferase [Polyangiaceae bacterium]